MPFIVTSVNASLHNFLVKIHTKQVCTFSCTNQHQVLSFLPIQDLHCIKIFSKEFFLKMQTHVQLITTTSFTALQGTIPPNSIHRGSCSSERECQESQNKPYFMPSKGTEHTRAILSLKSNHQTTWVLYDQTSQTTLLHALKSTVYQGKFMAQVNEFQQWSEGSFSCNTSFARGTSNLRAKLKL